MALYDDDLIDVDFISTCLEAVPSHGEPGVILTGAREIDSHGNVLSSSHNTVSGYSTAAFILGWFERKVPLYLCSTLFNTERLKQLGGFHSKTNLYEDVVAFVQLAGRYGRVDVFDIKASFRRHPNNMGKTVPYCEWSEDALYLLDIMCETAPEQAAVIRRKGLPYFSTKLYGHVARIKSPLKRVAAYFTVYKTFDRCYSPLKFMYVENAGRIMNFVKRQIASI